MATSTNESKVSNPVVNVHLEANTRHGLTSLEVEQYSNGVELSTTMQGKFAGDDYYGKLCLGDRGHLAVLHIRYRGKFRTIVLSDTDESLIGQISLLNGFKEPKIFRLDLKRLNASDNFTFENLAKCVLDNKENEFTEILKVNEEENIKANEVREIFSNDPNFITLQKANTAAQTKTNWASYCWLYVVPAAGILMYAFPKCRY